MPIQETPASIFQEMSKAYQRVFNAVGENITVRENTAPGTWTDHGPILSRATALRPEDIQAGSTLKQGDLKFVVLALTFPVSRRLEQKDRIRWRGRDYGVVSDDFASTRSTSGNPLAREIVARG
jgi:hypothetical protein